MNHFTETTTTSFGSNILNSFKGILFGFALLVGSIYLLSYNEHRSINQTLALEEMQEKIVLLPSSQHNPKYEQQPILIQDDVQPIHALEDTIFTVKSDALILERNVEMYQWVEEKHTEEEKNAGGSTTTITTYDYNLEWSSYPVDSTEFRHPTNHENPEMPYRSKTYMTDANIGDFYLSESVISHFSANKSFEGLASMPATVANLQNHKTFLYKGENPESPVLGDVKISYTEAGQGLYTLAGKQEQKTLVSYQTQNEINLLFVREGKVSAEQIFKEEFRSNTILTWVLRAVGLMLMFFGFMLIMNLLETLANVIPFLGDVIGGITAIVAGALTLMFGSLVIAIAWFAVRPMMSLSIVAIGIGLAVLVKKMKR